MPHKKDFLNQLNYEFDYNILCNSLKPLKHPRDQITKLIHSGEIIRVKKGIYVRGDSSSKPYSKYVLANMIYGPSYISGNSALAWWQAIPERVEQIESTTCNRKKAFDTPVGTFVYRYLALNKYCVGLQRVNLDKDRSFLIASREKSITEEMITEKGISCVADLWDWMYSKSLFCVAL